MHIIMPSQAASLAGVRFEVQDASATENARRILEAISLKEEILQATRRTKVHTSMLEYTEHAQRMKRNRINLDKLSHRSHRGLVSYPIMQFDNTLALSGFPPNHLQLLNDRVPTRTYKSKTRANDHALKHITWVPETTLNHFSVMPQTDNQNKVRKIAILKSNDEIVYANYNVSGSGTAVGEQIASGKTAAATESLLDNDVAEGDEYLQLRGNQNDVKTVGSAANIRLRQPDTFHPGILPGPGQEGKRKLTPRFTLDITLPRMETDEQSAPCPSPCSQEGETYDDGNENMENVKIDELTELSNKESRKQDLGGCSDAKHVQRINTGNNEHVTMRCSCPPCRAERSNGSNGQTAATNNTSIVTNPNNLPSTHSKSASNDQTPAYRQRAVTFRAGIKTKEGQQRRYNMRRSRSQRNEFPDTTFLEKYQKCNVTEIRLGEDHTKVLLTDAQNNCVTPPSMPQNGDSYLNNLTLRSILKVEDANKSSKKDGTITEATPISNVDIKEPDSQEKQATQRDVKTNKYPKGKTNKRNKISSLDKDAIPKVKIKDDFIQQLAPESYHKAYIVNTQPIPAHMKRILENAMQSAPKLDKGHSLQNVTGNEKSQIDVNQACEILDNMSEHTKHRDNRRVCRHGMFLANCSVCKALVEIQQRLKFNIKKHVQDKFQWNLLSRMQHNEKIKWPITSDSPASAVSYVEKKSVKLPVLKSTISMTEFKKIRRKKQGNDDHINISERETMHPPHVHTIAFNDTSEPKELDQTADNELSSPRRKKKVTFAERNIYRQMVGYKV